MANSHIFFPETYGIPGNQPDDAPLIQAALNQAEQSGGGIVQLSGKNYKIYSTLNIPGGVSLNGVGWGEAPPFTGSYLHVKNANITPILINKGMQESCSLHDFAIRYDQPDPAILPWSPLNAPYAVDVQGVNSVHISNIFLFNASNGIRGIRSGRLQLDRIYGQTLINGIYLDDVHDALRISNVHFWPFWTFYLHNPNLFKTVDDYTVSHASGITLANCDNPHISNVFFYAYKKGINLTASQHGITSKLRISQIDCDYCECGIYVDGAGTTAQVSNFTSQGTNIPGSLGVFINADRAKLQMTNVRISDCQTNGIRIQGNDSLIMADNIWIESWDQSQQGFPAVEAFDSGSSCILGKTRFFQTNGGIGPYIGGAGSVDVDN